MARILIIDDDEDFCDALRITLERAGYEVVCASNGRRGLELHRHAPVDVIVTDIFMPDTDGIETIQTLRHESPQTRIIAMSGGGEFQRPGEYLTIARHLGACGVLNKPFDCATLLDAIGELVGPPGPQSPRHARTF